MPQGSTVKANNLPDDGESVIAFFVDSAGKSECRTDIKNPLHKLALLGVMELSINKMRDDLKSSLSFS